MAKGSYDLSTANTYSPWEWDRPDEGNVSGALALSTTKYPEPGSFLHGIKTHGGRVD
jgi:hypothetical protein